MDLFPRSFLLVFAQLAVGGFFCMSLPPFHEIDRGYYKSSSAVYLASGLLALIGRAALFFDRGESDASGLDAVEIALWFFFLLAAAGYLWSLWGEYVILRARLFAATWMLGSIALIVASESYRQSTVLSVETVLYPLSFLNSALLLGAGSGGMLLGHWYLIDRDLSLVPLNRMLSLYVFSLRAQLAIMVVGCLLLLVLGADPSVASLHRLFGDHRALLITRLVVSPIGASVLGAMIWRTLQIPQTMAATGLFYIAVLAVLVGEFLGRFILFRTGLPL
jgi:DMSO reductase anchor subunit